MHRYVWAAVTLLAVSAGAVALHLTDEPPDLQQQLVSRVRTTLEEADPATHQHAGHSGPPGRQAVVCGIRLYGYEPSDVTELADVRTVYGFHMCGVAEPQLPWDVAVKLAGPVIVTMSDPPGIQVVEATENVRFVDRLHEMFPERYAQLALTEALTEPEMTDLRSRYDAAAGL
ncbi:hypothetical protein Aph02nite_46530 [Actinoplanes philippinensis]|uniref:DUF5753 domain-containing protein n=1 Tax=Actinoplanes philippinensis TaxID=35752 RepID=A0A1I2I240_9ACTN|nr:hypothetical protein [Actinoplanes philippinensis]GIE78703.1 hypothetical protein Aph02nite_46530 [Actinoplanes philippinensis]SFF36445.1 hypothetical protein SAMN05421541_109231 [Actinoplanes philippinensis]